jgi:hypothetical protein
VLRAAAGAYSIAIFEQNEYDMAVSVEPRTLTGPGQKKEIRFGDENTTF